MQQTAHCGDHVNVPKLAVLQYPSGLWKNIFIQSASWSWRIVSSRKSAMWPAQENSRWRGCWRAAHSHWWTLFKTGNISLIASFFFNTSVDFIDKTQQAMNLTKEKTAATQFYPKACSSFGHVPNSRWFPSAANDIMHVAKRENVSPERTVQLQFSAQVVIYIYTKHIVLLIYHLFVARLSLVPSRGWSHLQWTARGAPDVVAAPQGGSVSPVFQSNKKGCTLYSSSNLISSGLN